MQCDEAGYRRHAADGQGSVGQLPRDTEKQVRALGNLLGDWLADVLLGPQVNRVAMSNSSPLLIASQTGPSAPSSAQLGFDRWLNPFGCTIAYRLAKGDLNEIGSFEGHVQGVLNHAQREIKLHPNEPLLSNLINYGSTLKPHYKVKTADAAPQLEAAANWTRLASLVFTASALELYIRRIVALSLESDPGLLIGSPRVVDGALRLKQGSALDTSTSVKECTEGVWSKRHAALERLFGPLPSTHAVLGMLDKLQTTRNAIAHDFARTSAAKDFWYLDPGEVKRLAVTSVTQNRLVSSIKAAIQTINEIDTVAVKHIGVFETVRFWHAFSSARAEVRTAVAERYKAMQKGGANAKIISSFHFEMAGHVLGRDYCNDLIAYYGRL